MRRWRRPRTAGSASRRWSDASRAWMMGSRTRVRRAVNRVVRRGASRVVRRGGTRASAGVVGRLTGRWLGVQCLTVARLRTLNLHGTLEARKRCRGRRRSRGRRTARWMRTTTASSPGCWRDSGTRCDDSGGRRGRARGRAARDRWAGRAGCSGARDRRGRGRRRGSTSCGRRCDGGRAAWVAAGRRRLAASVDDRGRSRRRTPDLRACGPVPARERSAHRNDAPGVGGAGDEYGRGRSGCGFGRGGRTRYVPRGRVVDDAWRRRHTRRRRLGG